MTQIIAELLGTLKIIGQVYLAKLGREWQEDIEKLEERLWEQTNKPDISPDPSKPWLGKDMAVIVNILEEVKRKNKKAQDFMIQQIASGGK